MGETIDTFGRLKFCLSQNLPFQAETCTAGRAKVIDASFGRYGDF